MRKLLISVLLIFAIAFNVTSCDLLASKGIDVEGFISSIINRGEDNNNDGYYDKHWYNLDGQDFGSWGPPSVFRDAETGIAITVEWMYSTSGIRYKIQNIDWGRYDW